MGKAGDPNLLFAKGHGALWVQTLPFKVMGVRRVVWQRWDLLLKTAQNLDPLLPNMDP